MACPPVSSPTVRLVLSWRPRRIIAEPLAYHLFRAVQQVAKPLPLARVPGLRVWAVDGVQDGAYCSFDLLCKCLPVVLFNDAKHCALVRIAARYSNDLR